jgi:myo-inositol catabolism protein IolC
LAAARRPFFRGFTVASTPFVAAARRPFFRGFTVGSTPFVAADVRPFFRGFAVGRTPFGAADARNVATLALTSANARWHGGRLGASTRS